MATCEGILNECMCLLMANSSTTDTSYIPSPLLVEALDKPDNMSLYKFYLEHNDILALMRQYRQQLRGINTTVLRHSAATELQHLSALKKLSEVSAWGLDTLIL